MRATSRERSVSASGNGQVQDLLVIGGGVNGCGIARDATGRGLSVTLVEKGDLPGATSSSSTKRSHGGLRYLEYREFRLVREALIEREVLLRAAPHIVWPLRFVLPHHKGQYRKSTRLNSSHSSIAYAVFCLKIKIKNDY